LRATLPAQPASVRHARAQVRSLVAGWPPGCTATLQVLVDELVTNAVLHARTSLDVMARVEDHHIRVEVRDDDPRMPRLRKYGPTSSTGRGLHLVEALATLWGAERSSGGKVVWFEFECDGRTFG
jgi:anti-sigma regulatory factor (Ser/Thr protein kinase)